ncbi:hypothetical protein Aduo_016874 [Ancylostoma duodenale]
MIPVLLFYFTVVSVTAQERFRTILIDRACRHRPSLSFCSDFDPLPEPPTNDAVPLITPPPIEADQKSVSLPSAQLPTNVTFSEKTASVDEVDFGNSTQNDEHLGSLLRLPKPKKAPGEIPAALPEMENTAPIQQAVTGESSNITAASIEDEKSVLVFVSEYCVVERERFIKSCHGDVSEEQVPFCKSYPAACASTAGVIPVVSYCQRYYKHYPKFCGGSKIEQDVLQFCFAFEQFCLPELTPAQPVKRPQSSLRRCEDVLPEARKVCSPFPHPRDTFNVLRCSNFLTHCKKFVDWTS